MKTTPKLRHIVDVDGQLHGIEPATISTAVLRAIAGIRGDLVQVCGSFEVPLADRQTITLRQDEVLFFRSQICGTRFDRLAA